MIARSAATTAPRPSVIAAPIRNAGIQLPRATSGWSIANSAARPASTTAVSRPPRATTHSRKPSTGSGVATVSSAGDRVGLTLGRLPRHRLLDRQDLGPLVLAGDADLLGLAHGLHWLSISAPTSIVTVTSVATATVR